MPALPGIMRSGDRRYHGTFVGRTGCDAVHGVTVADRFADFELNQVSRIDARITRRTEGALGISDGFAEGVHRDVTEGIGAEEAADFFGSVGGGDELFFCGRIDAVVARGNSG